MSETSMAKIEGSPFQSDVTSDNRIRVRVRSVDEMVTAGEIEPPDIMKIDVEGAEMLVLEGAKNTLQLHHPVLFVEIHSSELLEQCTSLLEELGYVVEALDENPLAARSRDVFQIRANKK